MFKVPEWGEDVPKNNIHFAKKVNIKMKTKLLETKALTNDFNNLNSKNETTENLNRLKAKKRRRPKKKQIVELSEMKNNEKSTSELDVNTSIEKNVLKQQINNTNSVSTKKTKKQKIRNKNKIVNGNTQTAEKECVQNNKQDNIVTPDPSQGKQRQINGTEGIPKKRKLDSKKQEIEEDIDYENLDSDKPDEMLLEMKKRKFCEALKNDDREDLLFSEEDTKSPKKKKVVLNKKENNKEKNNKKESNKEESLFSEEPSDNKEKNISNQGVQNPHLSKKKNSTDFKIKMKCKKILESVNKNKDNDSNRNPIKTNSNKLRERMLEKLKAAQFRYLNERLYTSSGSDAKQLFQDDPNAFHTYHQGYQLQLKKWPVNPLDVMVKKISKMPKTHLIADMGCGEAALSKRVPHTVRSFDLVSTAPGVEACDMAHTPLLAASVDVAVYCLALMGTDLTQYLVEANRVLKTGGCLLIAEVESRFDDVDGFVRDVQRLGFKLKSLDKTHKVFFFMEFRKIQDPPAKKAKRPLLTLKPCLYKRR